MAAASAPAQRPRAKRVLVVSNRLPFSVQRTEQGVELVASAGGLVSALSGYLQRRKLEQPDVEFVWAGWAGADLSAEETERLRADAREKHGAYPLSLDAANMDRFYHGFCNGTLWPLFHYFPSYATYDEQDWETYRRVNQSFCDELAQLVQPDDEIWVHDYQLLLLPGLLRKRLPDASIGFFLHIPFPSFEVFRQLPTRWRGELLEGVLGADLMGFHTHDYAQHFLHSVFRTLGYEHYLGQINVAGALRRVETFPIGIDYARFSEAAASPEVAEARTRMASGLAQRKVIFSVDRLDYSKGILHRLRGFEAFLSASPEYHGQVSFVLLVVPSREQVAQYQRMKQELDERVGQINGRFGTVDWVPIVYQYRSVPFTELVALYNLADVALITPLRDGMNLVAKEYVASKPDGDGVLILSDMAGAARELGEALQINPNHTREIADAIHEALTMPAADQQRRMRAMQARIEAYDATRWVETFLGALRRTKERQGRLATRHLTGASLSEVLQRHRKAARRVLLLDYDGTLVPLARTPADAAPDRELLALLRELQTPSRTVYVVSGRDHRSLAQWFEDVPIRLVAEHGAWERDAEGNWTMPKPLPDHWKKQLRPLLQSYVERVPGSSLEEKDFALVWHYRLAADQELAAERAKELTDDVVSYSANLDVQVLEGKKAIELRNSGVTKGVAAAAAVADGPEFVFAAGDDATDEDLFRALPRDAVTVCVGGVHSHATYRIADYRELRAVLHQLLPD
ncbi:MAG: bifunctional alpha,alpha-trehalose-phosphate synthase (UDP-forming)/trehalose-phosphatase [Myxococcales bacterium]